MILTGDYHTHTPYSHGKNTVEENVAKAKEVGLKQIAITDHGFSHVAFGLRRRQVEKYIHECKAASEKYGIDVLRFSNKDIDEKFESVCNIIDKIINDRIRKMS